MPKNHHLNDVWILHTCVFCLDNCACPRIEYYSPDGSILSDLYGIYSRRVEKVNNRYFYTSEEHSGEYGIWQCRYDNTQIVQWVIGATRDKGRCVGEAFNFQDKVCPPSITGYTWWVYLDNLKRFDTALKGIAVRCVTDDYQKTTSGHLNFVAAKEVGRSSNSIPSMILGNVNAPPVFGTRATYQGPQNVRLVSKFSEN